MRLAHLLLVVLAVGSGVVTVTAWRGAGATARAELIDRGHGLVPILVTALLESQGRAHDSIAREKQRLLSVARRARLEVSLPLGPLRERLEALAREEHVGRLYLFDKAGGSVARITLGAVELALPAAAPDPDDALAPLSPPPALFVSPVSLDDERHIQRLVARLLAPEIQEATEGLTQNVFGSAYRIVATVRTKDGGALLLATSADDLAELQRGQGAAGALRDVCRLPDVRSARLLERGEVVAEAGERPRAEDLTFKGSLPSAQTPHVSVELRLLTERVDSLVVAERARILLWGGLASGVTLLSAFLLWRRERALAQQRARDEAAQREQQRLAEMGVLTGLFVHEVSNPLNALGLQLEGVKRAVGATGAEEIARVKGTLGRVRSALEAFLQVAMPMEGRVGETYGVERLRRTVADLRAESPAAGLVLEVAPQAEARVVAARVPVLDQALRNLLRNALQAAPAASVVVARWEAGEQAGVSLSVRDSGPGFPAPVLASGGTLGGSGRREGHGLGLYLARRIVEGLGGRMTLANPEGGGAEVRVWLPAAAGALPVVPGSGT